MKRVFLSSLTLALCLMAATALAADPKFLRIGTASLGGNFFPMGAAIASVIDQHVPGIKATAQASSGSAFNMTAIQDGEQEMAVCQGPAVSDAVANGKTPDVRTIANYSATPQHFMVRIGANIKSVADLKGKKMEMLAAGDGVEVSTRKVLSALGMKWEDIKPEYSGNRVQAASRLKTGQVDGIIDATGLGAAWITDIVGDGSRFTFLSLSDAEMGKILSANKEFSRMDIPAGTYRGQEKTVPGVGVWTVIVCSKNLSDDLVYNITKQLFANQQFLKERHNYFKDLTPQNIVGAVVAPLHPGAARYYKEVGVLK
jgi:TRAP transporter TAXI family solute receptor